MPISDPSDPRVHHPDPHRGAAGNAFLPVGAILAYAGADTSKLADAGWLPCDGAAVATKDRPELAAAIKQAFGSTDADHVNLPLLQGAFLRCVDGGAGQDTRAAARMAWKPGGATGDAVGSCQEDGTGMPQHPFRSAIEKYDLTSSHDEPGVADKPAKWHAGTTRVETSGGGDHESRPINKYVQFIIKASLVAGGDYVMPPIGAVISYAGIAPPEPTHWLMCDGAPVTTLGEWAALYAAIGYAHGQGGPDLMMLPDYRGYFLRGVGAGTGHDPDAARRTAPFPDGAAGEQGNTGDAVGSVQGFATRRPRTPFITHFKNLPQSTVNKGRTAGSAYNLANYNPGAVTVNLTKAGGDRETRPRNWAVDWFIRFR